MNVRFSTLDPVAALRPCLLAALSGLWLAGCGGTGKELAEATPAAQAASVRLEGCVVDAQWLSAPGVAVHVRSAAGQALGTAVTDSRGVFRLAVPARTRIVVDTAVGGQGGAVLDIGSTSLTVAGCLASSV
ncbi:MAG: hypothetical protein JNM33_06415 [Rubrivivax sp.]|nr:hypothetical protein [Rubrivivax sp.]